MMLRGRLAFVRRPDGCEHGIEIVRVLRMERDARMRVVRDGRHGSDGSHVVIRKYPRSPKQGPDQSLIARFSLCSCDLRVDG